MKVRVYSFNYCLVKFVLEMKDVTKLCNKQMIRKHDSVMCYVCYVVSCCRIR